MKDERVQATVNRFAAGGFFIWYSLMWISLCYRMLILKQHFRDFWDIAAIFFIGTLFVFIAYASKGVLDQGFKRTSLLGIFIGATIGVLTWQLIAGRMHSVADAGALLIGFLPGMGLVIAIAYLLNRRWKRKEGIEDEK
jgi:hypothetical protein